MRVCLCVCVYGFGLTGGIKAVVFGCPARRLGEISGEELDVNCKNIFNAGILHKVSSGGMTDYRKCCTLVRGEYVSAA